MLIHEAFKSLREPKEQGGNTQRCFFIAFNHSNESDLAGAACPATLSFFPWRDSPPAKGFLILSQIILSFSLPIVV
jgi:hypothetical protein